MPVFKMLVVVIAVAASLSVHDQSYLLSEVLQHFCVHGNVCPTNNSYTVLESTDDDVASCCSDCSCEADCNQQNCCFTRDRQSTTPVDRSNQQCLHTTAKSPKKWEQHLYPAYYMVTVPPTDGCQSDTDTDTNTDANTNTDVDQNKGERRVSAKAQRFSLGELYPVYSPSTHRIFANLSLAQCYGEHDVIPWTPVLTCQKTSNALPRQAMDLSTHALALLDPNKYPFCETRFYYLLGNPSDVATERCYNDMVDSCDKNASEILVPFGTSMSAKEIVDACESEFYSPYLYVGSFANVFCYICSGRFFNKYKECPARSFRHDGQSFMWLLKPNVGRTIKTLAEARTGPKEACPFPDSPEKDCRTIHCPTGQLRTSDNTCVWPFTSSGNSTYRMYVKLTTSQPLTTHDILTDLNAASEDGFPVNLTSPWSHPWEVQYMWYVPKGSNRSQSMDMLVAYLQSFTADPFETILGSISETLPKKWRWRRGDLDIDFDQDFSPRTIELVTFGSPVGYFFSDASRELVDPREPTLIHAAGEHRKYALTLSKLYSCDQIELTQDEFIFDETKTLLTSKLADRKYLDGEFALLENNRKKLSARICLSDSTFVKREEEEEESDGIAIHVSWWTSIITYAVVGLFFDSLSPDKS